MWILPSQLSKCAPDMAALDLESKTSLASDCEPSHIVSLRGTLKLNLISKMEKGLLDAAPIWSDLKTFPYKDFHGLVDILIAGYPCQPFSAAGKRAGKDDPRHLWPWIADGIQLLRPRMCLFENVEGHISLGLSTVISDLEELGYKVAAGLFSASECLDASGRTAPHQRKRIFIMAYDKQQGLEGFSKYRASICRKDQRIFTWDGSSREELADNKSKTSGGLCQRTQTQKSEFGFNCETGIGAWPSRPGQQQYAWEPPRVVGNADHGRLASGLNSGSGAEADRGGQGDIEQAESGQAQPPLGRDAYEPPIGMDLSELSSISHQELAEICDWMVKTESRTDELRLLGNGVVPATAERAFLTLIEELNK